MLKRKKLFRDEVKERHTSHWDLDMMSHEELEAMMAKKKSPPAEDTTAKDQTNSAKADRSR